MFPPFRVRRILPVESYNDSFEDSPSTAENVFAEPADAVEPPTQLPETSKSSSGDVATVNMQYTDGIISMTKIEYEDLIQQQPQAALRYLDDNDGEIIMVGSAFELDQRLMEPVEELKPSGNIPSSEHLHSFDVERKQDVINTWCKIHGRNETKEIDTPNKQPSGPVSFGETTPLAHNAPKGVGGAPADSTHARRWASYGSLPSLGSYGSSLASGYNTKAWIEKLEQALGGLNASSSSQPQKHVFSSSQITNSRSPEMSLEEIQLASHMSQPLLEVTAWTTKNDSAVHEQEVECSPEELRLASYTSQASSHAESAMAKTMSLAQADTDSTSKAVRSSTLQFPSSSTQQNEYMPLLELFEAQLAKLGPSMNHSDTKQISIDSAKSTCEKSSTTNEKQRKNANNNSAGVSVLNATTPEEQESPSGIESVDSFVADVLATLVERIESSCRSLVSELSEPITRTHKTFLDEIKALVRKHVRLVEPKTDAESDGNADTTSDKNQESNAFKDFKFGSTEEEWEKRGLASTRYTDDDLENFPPGLKDACIAPPKPERDSLFCQVPQNPAVSELFEQKLSSELSSEKPLMKKERPDKILGRRYITYDSPTLGQNVVQFLVRWTEQCPDVWCNRADLEFCMDLVTDFELKCVDEWKSGWRPPHMKAFEEREKRRIEKRERLWAEMDFGRRRRTTPYSGRNFEPFMRDEPLRASRGSTGIKCPICGEIFFDSGSSSMVFKCKCAESPWKDNCKFTQTPFAHVTRSSPPKPFAGIASSASSMRNPEIEGKDFSVFLAQNSDPMKEVDIDTSENTVRQQKRTTAISTAPYQADAPSEPTGHSYVWKVPRKHSRRLYRLDARPMQFTEINPIKSSTTPDSVTLSQPPAFIEPLIEDQTLWHSFDRIASQRRRAHIREGKKPAELDTTVRQVYDDGPLIDFDNPAEASVPQEDQAVTTASASNRKSSDAKYDWILSKSELIQEIIAAGSKNVDSSKTLHPEQANTVKTSNPTTKSAPAEPSDRRPINDFSPDLESLLFPPVSQGKSETATESKKTLETPKTSGNLAQPSGEQQNHQCYNLVEPVNSENGPRIPRSYQAKPAPLFTPRPRRVSSLKTHSSYPTLPVQNGESSNHGGNASSQPNRYSLNIKPRTSAPVLQCNEWGFHGLEEVPRIPPAELAAPPTISMPLRPSAPSATTGHPPPPPPKPTRPARPYTLTTPTVNPKLPPAPVEPAALSTAPPPRHRPARARPSPPPPPMPPRGPPPAYNATPQIPQSPEEEAESSLAAIARQCAEQLIEMGFPPEKALLVAGQAHGDMEKAIDMLEDDAKVWKGQAKGKAKGLTRDPVPGSWDDELYG